MKMKLLKTVRTVKADDEDSELRKAVTEFEKAAEEANEIIDKKLRPAILKIIKSGEKGKEFFHNFLKKDFELVRLHSLYLSEVSWRLPSLKVKKGDSSFLDSYKDILNDLLNLRKASDGSARMSLFFAYKDLNSSIQYAQNRRSQEWVDLIKKKIQKTIGFLGGASQSEPALRKEVEVLIKKIKAIQPEIIKIAEEEKEG